MLLDTCALIWLSTGGGQLSNRTLKMIGECDLLTVSSISSFEVAHVYKKGRLDLPCDPERWFHDILVHHDIAEIKIDSKIAIAATKLPDIHRDPCDRFIIATAILSKVPIVTKDKQFKKYGVEVIS